MSRPAIIDRLYHRLLFGGKVNRIGHFVSFSGIPSVEYSILCGCSGDMEFRGILEEEREEEVRNRLPVVSVKLYGLDDGTSVFVGECEWCGRIHYLPLSFRSEVRKV